MAAVQQGSVLRGASETGSNRWRLCENASGTDLGKKSTSQIALYAFFLTGLMVRRPLNFMLGRVFTQPQPDSSRSVYHGSRSLMSVFRGVAVNGRQAEARLKVRYYEI